MNLKSKSSIIPQSYNYEFFLFFQEIKALNIISEKEKEKNEELSNEIVRLKSTAKFREDAFIEEHKRRIESEEQVKVSFKGIWVLRMIKVNFFLMFRFYDFCN